MDNDPNLSSEYFEPRPSASLEGIDDEAFNFNSLDSLPLDSINEYDMEMPSESQTTVPARPINNNIQESQPSQENTIDNNIETTNKEDNLKPDNNTSNNNNILDEIKNINDEILTLQNKLNDLDNGNIPVEANNDQYKQIAKETIPLQNNNIEQVDTNDIVEVTPNPGIENLNKEFNTSNVFQNENVLNSDEITNKIIKLNNKKEELVKKVVENEIKNLTTNSKNDFNEYGKIKVDNFTPNFAFIGDEEQDAINNAVETETAMGKQPKLVTDSKGVPAVISEDQVDLKTAIDQHGGVEQAINDSVNNQTFFNSDVKNTSEPADVFNNFNNSDTFETSENIDSYVQSNLPDSFDIVAENTKATMNAVLDISKQFGNIINVLNRGFSNVSNSMRNINASKNYNQNIYNNKSQQSVDIMSRNKESITPNPIPTNIKSDFPQSSDFPSGFDLSSLGGSNLMR